MPKSKRGFTVVEVLCVTTILLIITSFTVPQIWRAIDEAYNVSARFSISTIESVYRLTRAFMIIDSDAPDTPQPMQVDYEVHIPARYEDVKTDYTTYMAQKISDAYAGNPPIYEITEFVKPSGTARRVRLWPEQNDKNKCYQYENGSLVIMDLAPPDTHDNALQKKLDELYSSLDDSAASTAESAAPAN